MVKYDFVQGDGKRLFQRQQLHVELAQLRDGLNQVSLLLFSPHDIDSHPTSGPVGDPNNAVPVRWDFPIEGRKRDVQNLKPAQGRLILEVMPWQELILPWNSSQLQ